MIRPISNNAPAAFLAGQGFGALTDANRLNRPSRDLATVVEGASKLMPGLPPGQVIGHFIGHVITRDTASEYRDDAEELTDNRYYVRRCIPQPSLENEDPLEGEEDRGFSTYQRVIVATNLAEKLQQTHLLPEGSELLVHVFAYVVGLEAGSAVHYYFTSGGGSDNGGLWYVSGPVLGSGGHYEARPVTGTSTADTGDDLALPEGLTVADSDQTVLLLNAEEDGLATHWLRTGAYVLGRQVGTTEGGMTIVVTHGGPGRTASPAALATANPADAHSWDRNAVASGDAHGDCPVELPVVTNVLYDLSAKTLYRFTRVLKFDAGGRLFHVGPETRETIDELTSACQTL